VKCDGSVIEDGIFMVCDIDVCTVDGDVDAGTFNLRLLKNMVRCCCRCTFDDRIL